MPTDVEIAEARARSAYARLVASVESGDTLAFTSEQCRSLTGLVDALRDNQAADRGGNPFETPCPACNGRPADDDDEPCDTCDNLRFVPTKAGRRILDLVMRHLITDDEDLWADGPDTPVGPTAEARADGRTEGYEP